MGEKGSKTRPCHTVAQVGGRVPSPDSRPRVLARKPEHASPDSGPVTEANTLSFIVGCCHLPLRVVARGEHCAPDGPPTARTRPRPGQHIPAEAPKPRNTEGVTSGLALFTVISNKDALTASLCSPNALKLISHRVPGEEAPQSSVFSSTLSPQTGPSPFFSQTRPLSKGRAGAGNQIPAR